MKFKKIFTSLAAFIIGINTFAQSTSPSLEFAKITGDNNPVGNGPVNTTTINFVKNSDNPAGNTFSTYTPALSATFTLSNPQYTASTYTFSQTGGPVAMGYTGSASPIYTTPYGSPINSYFTSSGATSGNGLSTANNSFVTLMASTNFARVNNLSTSGRHYVQRLTITFNRAVDNPILHLSGLGGQVGTFGFSTEFNVSANISVSLTKLSGTTPLVVSGSQINKGASSMGPSGANAGSGSVQITGKGITTLTLDIYIHGDGSLSSPNNWATQNSGTNSGDAISIGISVLESDLSVTKTVDNSTPDTADNVVFTIIATNNGASNNTNVAVNDALPNGYSYVSYTATTGSYNSSTGIWTIGALAAGANATLTITAKVNSAGSYANTATVSGDLLDPDSTNNSATSTPVPTGYCKKPGSSVPGGTPTKVGITNQTKLSTWPQAVPNGHITLESKTNGFVITRVANSGVITEPKKGMLIYDIAASCVKLYNGTIWKCIQRGCNE